MRRNPHDLRILIFGTFDERRHPRTRVLREGLTEAGHDVEVLNVPLAFDTSARVALARRPWTAPLIAVRLLWAWAKLLARSARVTRPDVVIVGYLGTLDVHLARLRFRCPVVLDQLVTMGGTVRDRQLDRSGKLIKVLDWVDRRAVRSADLVIVDTAEQMELLPESQSHKVMVVPVGAGNEWFTDHPGVAGGTLRVVFFGLYTPLQGATFIGEAIRRVPNASTVEFTMIGSGQDLEATRRIIGHDDRVNWIDWVDVESLTLLVASHDVCLGIFGTTPKSQRVVPNKVYQGAAAGCAIITSNTPPQRRALGDAAMYVEPGDSDALALLIVKLADDRALLGILRRSAHDVATKRFAPNHLVSDLISRVETLQR